MHRIVFLDRSTLDAHVRSPSFAHDWTDHSTTRPAQVARRLRGATMAVTHRVALTREVLSILPALRLVAVAATDVSHVDLAACRDQGIVVCQVRGYAVDSVAEHVLGGLLTLSRNLFGYRRAVSRGDWTRARTFCAHLFPIHEVGGSTLVIYGHGATGRATAARARALGMQVLLSERRGAAEVREGRIEFDEALARADVFSLHCPFAPGAERLIDAEALSRMRSTALLVNTAHGRLVDLDALHLALADHRIGGALLDVLPQEPPLDGHALLDSELSNLIVTPHIAWASQRAQHALAEGLVDNLEAFVHGRLTEDLARVG